LRFIRISFVKNQESLFFSSPKLSQKKHEITKKSQKVSKLGQYTDSRHKITTIRRATMSSIKWYLLLPPSHCHTPLKQLRKPLDRVAAGAAEAAPEQGIPLFIIIIIIFL
jgi:hypothetical protein